MPVRKRRLATVYLDTGEIIEDLLVAAPKKRQPEGEFIMAAQDGFLRLADDPEITGQDYRVLMCYLGSLDFENYLQINQTWIADKLEIAKEQVSRSTKKLVEKGILIKGSKVGRFQTYRLNPFYGWKGKADKEYWEQYEEHARKYKTK